MNIQNTDHFSSVYWDFAACIYHKMAPETPDILYGPIAPSENSLNLLGEISDKAILDLGTGSGTCALAFAKKGGICTSIDISEKQIQFAQEKAEKMNLSITFKKHSFNDLDCFGSDQFDIVFSSYALQYADSLTKTFNDVARILKSNGKFVFSFDHPIFQVLDKNNMRITGDYTKPGLKTKANGITGENAPDYYYYQRRFSDIVNPLSDAGFRFRMIEPQISEAHLKHFLKPQDHEITVPATIIFACDKV